jgi:hypothetical protein
MTLDGLWSAEIFGLLGWESIGVMVMEEGRAVGGGNNHLSMGRYRLDGNQVEMTLDLFYHGKPRTVFGARDKELQVRLKGRFEEGAIEGIAYRPDKEDLSLTFRLTKRADLPPRPE